MTVVPDYLEPLVGARLWLLNMSTGQLHSCAFYAVVWPPGEALRRSDMCMSRAYGPGLWSGHGPGIYAYKSVEHLAADSELYIFPSRIAERYDRSVRLVGGTISLWGEVHIHVNGYRGACGYPREFVCLDRIFPEAAAPRAVVQQLACHFGVPLATEATHEDWYIRTNSHRRAPVYAPTLVYAGVPVRIPISYGVITYKPSAPDGK